MKKIEVLELALDKIDEHYEKLEQECRRFKWICHDHLPQSGPGYVKNKNVFDIEDETIKDIVNSRKEAREILMKIIKESYKD